MGPSRCVRITAVMNHGPFELQVTIIFMLDRSPWTRGVISQEVPFQEWDFHLLSIFSVWPKGSEGRVH